MKRHLLCPALILAALLCCLALPAVAQENPGDPLLKALEKDYPPEEPLLALDTKIVSEYLEVAKDSIGTIDFVENEAYVLHSGDASTAFKAQKSKPIYPDDTLVAMPNSRLTVLLKDQSQFTMGAASKLTLEKNLYDPAAGTRETVVGMVAGKARFVVTKLAKGKDEDFQVKTPLAVIGVRGSDFVVAFVPESELPTLKKRSWLDIFSPVSVAYAQVRPTGGQRTVTLAGPNTTLGVRGLVGPPVIISSFQVTTIAPGRPPSPPLNVTPGATPGVMNRVGPAPSVMSMPPVFE